VALPTYRSFTVRAKASELILAAESGKQALYEYIVVNGTFPPATFTIPNITSTMVSSAVYNSTAKSIRITAVSAAAGLGAAAEIDLIASLNSSGSVNWACTPILGTQYMPASCN
jgi:type IV pilus assembly protein PilA